MVDIRVRVRQVPAALIRIRQEITQHVFVNFFLKVHANRAVDANDLIAANPSVRGDITIGIRNANICGIVTHRMMRAFDSGRDQSLEELAACAGQFRPFLCERRRSVQDDHRAERNQASHRRCLITHI